MQNRSALITCIGIALVAFFAIRTAAPPDAKGVQAGDTVFSAMRAAGRLQQIAQAPHSIGTGQEVLVRQYILASCNNLGLETEILTGTGVYAFGSSMVSGRVHNILAKIRGTANTKALLIMGHYDSQPNTPGAGDNASAVVAMLETARALKAGAPPRNDILFLFTDGEEAGLLGSAAFVADSAQLKKIGLVMNFDNRGNTGISTTFEVNPQNGWVMNAYFRAAEFPSANSFSYEVYKQLSNYTDYTPFKNAGVTGLNSAFIEGYVNYHSMTDVAESMDPRSIQHLGGNMLSLAKYFSGVDLTGTKGSDVTYFNLAGSWVIHYPAGFNLILVLFTSLLFVYFLSRGIKKKLIPWKGFFAATGIYLFAAILMILSAVALPKILLALYPLYGRFYDNNAYNSIFYFFLLTATGIGIFCWVYRSAGKKISPEALFAGAWLILILVMNLVMSAAPTAVYLFLFPMIFLVALQTARLHRQGVNKKTLWGAADFLSLLPAVLLFAPTIYFSFIAFGLDRMFIPVMLLCFLLGMILPVLLPVLIPYGKWIISLLLISAGISGVLAHVESSFTPAHPLQTNLWYRLDADSAKAMRISDFTMMDSWNRNFFDSAALLQIPESGDGMRLRKTHAAPVIELKAPQLKVMVDSLVAGKRKLVLNLFSQRNAVSMQVLISRAAGLSDLSIDSVPVKAEKFYSDSSAYYLLNYSAPGKEGMILSFNTQAKSVFTVTLIDRTLGLAKETGFTPYPSNIIPGPGSTSNTMQVVKRFHF